MSGSVGALLPAFFALALGYTAGKYRTSGEHRGAGLSKLSLQFALPSALFVSMTGNRFDLLQQQRPLLVSLLVAHVGLFLLSFLVPSLLTSLRATGAVILALALATSFIPVFEIAFLQPPFGSGNDDAVRWFVLALNLMIPVVIIFLESNAETSTPDDLDAPSVKIETKAGIPSGSTSVLLGAPVLGLIIMPIAVHAPKEITSGLETIGSATSGVAVFTIGLVLASHSFHFSKEIFFRALGRIVIQTIMLFAFFHFLRVSGPYAIETLVCCSFSMVAIVVLFESKYCTFDPEVASVLLLPTATLIVTLPLTLAISV